MALKVFVSAGTPANDSQREFRDAVMRAIEIAGLTPRPLSARDWDYKHPLSPIRRAIDDCAGAIIIAYARYQFPSGTELRKDGSLPLSETSFPTVWNHIEGAMAYENGLPLLVIAQTGLRRDAILEETGDIKPFWVDITPSAIQADSFIGCLSSWKQDVEAVNRDRNNRKESTEKEVTIRQLFSLPWYEGLAIIATLLGTIVGALSIGFKFGKGEWPF